MKKALFVLCVIAVLFAAGCAQPSSYVLNEDTFFLVMTNMQYYPEQYEGKDITYTAFMYDLEDVDGNVYHCAVRKCSSGYGCKCGKDTVIGFILQTDMPLPEAYNQSEDSADKAWVTVKGRLNGSTKKVVTVHSYDADGNVRVGEDEKISFLTFIPSSVETVEDYSGLHYYVTK